MIDNVERPITRPLITVKTNVPPQIILYYKENVFFYYKRLIFMSRRGLISNQLYL